MSGQDLRKAIRYQLAVTASFYSLGADRCLHEIQGVTRNISSDGALIAADQSPQLGEVIDVAIVLPRLQGHGNGMKLLGKGAVLRVESTLDSSNKFEFAICAHWRPQRGDTWSGDLRGWVPNDARSGYRN